MSPRLTPRPGDPPETTDTDVGQTSPTPETPAATAESVADDAPQGLTPAWDPDEAIVDGRPTAVVAAQDIAVQLGHDQTTDQSEEA
jgi:hypothetical protein